MHCKGCVVTFFHCEDMTEYGTWINHVYPPSRRQHQEHQHQQQQHDKISGRQVSLLSGRFSPTQVQADTQRLAEHTSKRLRL
jgi:hypothetical protein